MNTRKERLFYLDFIRAIAAVSIVITHFNARYSAHIPEIKGRMIGLIGKEKIVTKKDLWDCVPKEEKIKFKMEDGKVFVDLERQYLPGYAAPSVTYQQKQIVSEAKSGLGAIGKGILAVLLAGGAALVGRIAYVDAVRKKRRRRRRRRK